MLITNAMDIVNYVTELVSKTQQTRRKINSFRGIRLYNKMKVRKYLFPSICNTEVT